MNSFALSVIVENHPSVLCKISGLFARRGYNIYSLTVGPTEDPSLSRMTIVVKGDEYMLEQIHKQLNKLVDVIKVIILEPEKSVFRELALIKVSAPDAASKSSINETVNVFRSKVIDMDSKSMTIEVAGDSGKVDAFINLMRPFGIKKIAKTGLTGLERGN